MRPSKYFYDKPLPKILDSKTVLIYRPHPVYSGDAETEAIIASKVEGVLLSRLQYIAETTPPVRNKKEEQEADHSDPL
jgi:hypothetical protein